MFNKRKQENPYSLKNKKRKKALNKKQDKISYDRLDKLPDEILIKILQLLSPLELLDVSEVNRKFHLLCDDKEIWKPQIEPLLRADGLSLADFLKSKFSKVTFFRWNSNLRLTVTSLIKLFGIATYSLSTFYELFYNTIIISDISPLCLAKIIARDEKKELNSIQLIGISGQTLAHAFSTIGDLNVIDYFINNNFDLEKKDSDRKTPLDILFLYTENITSLKLKEHFIKTSLSDEKKLFLAKKFFIFCKEKHNSYFSTLKNINTIMSKSKKIKSNKEFKLMTKIVNIFEENPKYETISFYLDGSELIEASKELCISLKEKMQLILNKPSQKQQSISPK